MNIVDYIPYGKENAITRAQLCNLTGLKDRVMRKCLEAARKETIILNAQDGKGYYRSDEEYDLRRQLKQNISRGTAILQQNKLILSKLKDIDGQMELEDV